MKLAITCGVLVVAASVAVSAGAACLFAACVSVDAWKQARQERRIQRAARELVAEVERELARERR